MAFNEGGFRRLFELDKAIRAGEYPNCTSFAKEFECSSKSVQRTIRYLRDSLDAPVAYDHVERGYYYTDPKWSLPVIGLTEAELFPLLVAIHMAEQFRGTPLAKNLDLIYNKLKTALPGELTVDSSYFDKQLVSFHTGPTREISEKVWANLMKALREKRVVRVTYLKPGVEVAETRLLEPIHLACVDGDWYLVAYSRMRRDIRHFAVSRVELVRLTSRSFEPHEFDVEKYFKDRFHRYIGRPGKLYQVAIKFSEESAKWIEERVWNPKQKIRKYKDGSLKLSFPAPALYEVKRWVLAWGKDAEVLKPKKLRDQVAAEAHALSRLYSE